MDVKSLVPWRSRGEMTKPEGTERVPSILGLHRQVDRLFDEFLRDFESPMLPAFATDWPALEVQDNDKETKVVAELPAWTKRTSICHCAKVFSPSRAKKPIKATAPSIASAGMVSSRAA